MIIRIIVPQLFENMEEATIGAWLKREGEPVRDGEAVCELITEKSTFELESPGAGSLLHLAAPEKSVVPVNFIIGVLGEPGDLTAQVLDEIHAVNAALQESASPSAPGASPLPSPSLNVPSLSVPSRSIPSIAPAASDSSGSAAGGGRVRATPAARRLAREMGVTIEEVAAAQPNKVLSEDDVRAFANRP